MITKIGKTVTLQSERQAQAAKLITFSAFIALTFSKSSPVSTHFGVIHQEKWEFW